MRRSRRRRAGNRRSVVRGGVETAQHGDGVPNLSAGCREQRAVVRTQSFRDVTGGAVEQRKGVQILRVEVGKVAGRVRFLRHPVEKLPEKELGANLAGPGRVARMRIAKQ